MNACSNYSDDSVAWHKPFFGGYRLYITPIVAMFGIIGNMVVVGIFLLEHKKSRFSVYCVAISLTHVLILVTNSLMDDFMGDGLKFRRANSQIKFDAWSRDMCRLMEFVPNCMYTASSGLLLIFSVDRILTIFQPMRYYSGHHRPLAIRACLVVLAGSVLLTLPLLISSTLRPRSANSTALPKCTINDRTVLGQATIFIKVFVTFVAPTFCILVVNVIICLKLWRATVQRQRLLSAPATPEQRQKNDGEMNRICGHLALNTAFLLFTLPLVVSMLLRQVQPCSRLYKDLSKMFSSIKDISYALDIVLYTVFLRNFRWRAVRYCVLPLLCCPGLRTSQLGLYLESRLMQMDSNSSRRKYSALVAGFSSYSSNNKRVLQALIFKSPNATSTSQATPVVTEILTTSGSRTPQQKPIKSVSYFDEPNSSSIAMLRSQPKDNDNSSQGYPETGDSENHSDSNHDNQNIDEFDSLHNQENIHFNGHDPDED